MKVLGVPDASEEAYVPSSGLPEDVREGVLLAAVEYVRARRAARVPAEKKLRGAVRLMVVRYPEQFGGSET